MGTISRRELIKALGLLAITPTGCISRNLIGQERSISEIEPQTGIILNDIHSKLNPTRVAKVLQVCSLDELAQTIRNAAKNGEMISVAGGRHSMGAQQFGSGTIHLDTRKLNRVISLDRERGIIEVEGGIQWPDLIHWTLTEQEGAPKIWGIRQKQTGADRMSIAGALSSNVHGRGLTLKPIIEDVESFTLIDAQGEILTCSRKENQELFRLVIGGYGLFGIIYSVKLRLSERQKLRRVVEIKDAREIAEAFAQRIQDGYLYGDFQFETDETSPTFLTRGVFACYLPVTIDTPIRENQKELAYEDWVDLLYIAHAQESKIFDRYSNYYLSTSDQTYWSDTHQLSIYPDHYHQEIDKRLKAKVQGTEMITEVYVPRSETYSFLTETAKKLREGGANVIYGTTRLIEKDDESFLPWAKQAYTCFVFNLHVDHDAPGLALAKQNFLQLIDLAQKRNGSFFLTYHKWATREQILKSYPQFLEFLKLKRKYDPKERFQSDWYRHYAKMFKDSR